MSKVQCPKSDIQNSKLFWMLADLKLQTPFEQLEVGKVYRQKEGLPRSSLRQM